MSSSYLSNNSLFFQTKIYFKIFCWISSFQIYIYLLNLMIRNWQSSGSKPYTLPFFVKYNFLKHDFKTLKKVDSISSQTLWNHVSGNFFQFPNLLRIQQFQDCNPSSVCLRVGEGSGQEGRREHMFCSPSILGTDYWNFLQSQ